MKITQTSRWKVSNTCGSVYVRDEGEFIVTKGDVWTPAGSVNVYHQTNKATGRSFGNMTMIVDGFMYVRNLEGPASALALTRAAGRMSRELSS